ncbi:hypothetical protein LJK88_25675 [Paenibacillus sp. P26]|nr:hypothetical protein LJK88_25675 [Paenibacillus sp. P26]
MSDFRFGPSSAIIAGIAVVVGAAGAGIAIILQKLIGFFTNLFYFHRFSLDFVAPYPNQLGWMNVLDPVIGGLIIGLMARYGSDKIRGHGIPEAMESILIGKSIVSPKVAVLKPISAAISIGAGAPSDLKARSSCQGIVGVSDRAIFSPDRQRKEGSPAVRCSIGYERNLSCPHCLNFLRRRAARI